MTMATGMYGLSLEKMLEGSAPDIDGDTIKDQLHSDTYTPNFDTHDFHNDLTNELAASGGYSTGGVTLASVTSGVSSGTYAFDSADKTWTTATFTARGDVHVDTTPGSTSTNQVLWARTFGSDVSVSSGTFTIQEPAAGIWTVDYTP